MLLLPFSPPCVCVVWGCLELCCVGHSYALSPLLPGYGTPPPPCVCTRTWRVGWLAVGFQVVWLVCRWLIGGLVGCWLVAGGVCVYMHRCSIVCGVGWGECVCVCVCVCCVDTCCVVLLHSVSVSKPACAAIARVFGGVVHIAFWRSSGGLVV